MRFSIHHLKVSIIGLLIILLVYVESNSYVVHTMEVMATAYNSLPSQTDWNHPTLAAWGDTLEPGIKCIAVSRDLIQMGLSHKAEVTIEGFPGSFLVLDKMNKRHKKSIDIYMGVDRTAANQWGKQKVIISWKVSKY